MVDFLVLGCPARATVLIFCSVFIDQFGQVVKGKECLRSESENLSQKCGVVLYQKCLRDGRVLVQTILFYHQVARCQAI